MTVLVIIAIILLVVVLYDSYKNYKIKFPNQLQDTNQTQQEKNNEIIAEYSDIELSNRMELLLEKVEDTELQTINLQKEQKEIFKLVHHRYGLGEYKYNRITKKFDKLNIK